MQEKTVERKRFQLYDKPGRHTFFIPVDSAFNVSKTKYKRIFLTTGYFFCLIEKAYRKKIAILCIQNFSPFLVDEDVVAGHVVQDALMFTSPIDSDPHTADKDTATYNENMESGIKVVARIHAGNQKDPSERNKGTGLDSQKCINKTKN